MSWTETEKTIRHNERQDAKMFGVKDFWDDAVVKHLIQKTERESTLPTCTMGEWLEQEGFSSWEEAMRECSQETSPAEETIALAQCQSSRRF